MAPSPRVFWSLALLLPLGCSAPPAPVAAPAAVAAPTAMEAPTAVAVTPPVATSVPSAEPQAPAPPPLPEVPSTTSLLASYSGPARFAAGAQATITFTLQNVGKAPEKLNLFVLAIPSLTLDVRDAQGQRLSPMPPPVPPREMAMATLAPGAKRTFTLSLDAFSPPLSPGHYTVRVRDERVHGTPLAFVIE